MIVTESSENRESIYNLVPKPKHELIKKPMYRSKFDPNSPIVGSTFGLHGTTVTVGRGVSELKKSRVISSTFGPANKTDCTPNNYLKKGSGAPCSPNRGNSKIGYFKRPDDISAKEHVPSRSDRPIMGLKTSKNYIKSNAVDAILSQPKIKPNTEINYLEKDTYGKVPDYLGNIKEELEREKTLIEGIVEDNMKSSEPDDEYSQMDENEKVQLVEKLKKRWDEVNQKYQKICHRMNNDTIGDIKRKEAQESELKQLEEDIELLSRPGPILIRK